MTRPAPTRDQIEATDPNRSNWVTANAGSGKTHVLTQRVARLLLTEASLYDQRHSEVITTLHI